MTTWSTCHIAMLTIIIAVIVEKRKVQYIENSPWRECHLNIRSDMLQQHFLPTHNVMIEKLKHLCRKHRALDFLQYITSFNCIMVVFLWIHYSSLFSLLSQAGHYPSHHISCYQRKWINNYTSFSTIVFRIGLYIFTDSKYIYQPSFPCEYHTILTVSSTVTQIMMSSVTCWSFSQGYFIIVA